MGFLSGRVSFERFRVSGKSVSTFDETMLEALDKHAIGKVGAMAADGIEMGFTAGDHILDLRFDLEKNIINDALHFAMRVDTNKVPSDLLKAYEKMEVDVLAAGNPSGFPTKQQKMQARETARERCEEEARTGKFRKVRQFPALWDARQGLVYFGSSSLTAMEQFIALFSTAFGRTLTRVTSGSLAHEMATALGQARALEDLAPAPFTSADRKMVVSWVQSDLGSRDFLGNEFLLWLWWVLDSQSDSVRLSDESVVACMMNKTLSLECPWAETGKETIAHEAPTRLPEARQAVRNGKLPRKSGLILVRHDEQYELAVQAETLSVGSASLPKLESDSMRAELEDRIDQIRHLTETVDLLYEAFLRRRLAGSWNDEMKKVRSWLKSDD